MLDVITGFFGYLSDMFTSMFDMFVEYITSIDDMFVVLMSIMSRVPIFFRWMPGEVMGILFSLFSIAIIYKVLGRS